MMMLTAGKHGALGTAKGRGPGWGERQCQRFWRQQQVVGRRMADVLVLVAVVAVNNITCGAHASWHEALSAVYV